MASIALPSLRRATCCALTVIGLSSPSVQALTFVDELTYFLTSATFSPGGTVSTQLTFATKPGISLSAFSFTLAWDTDLAAPIATGAGSIAEWGSHLASRGTFELLPSAAHSVTGRWTANALEPSTDVIQIPYSDPLRPVFTFQTSQMLSVPFVTSMQFFDIADGVGSTVDTGSGFINWATLTAVPEPASSALWLLGVAGLGALRARQSR